MDSRMTNRAVELISTLDCDCSVFFCDLASSTVFSHNDKAMRSASLIKLFILGEAYRQRRIGKIDFADTLILENRHRVGGAGELSQLPAGSAIIVINLVREMIVASDNAATNILMDKLGVESINNFIRQCGARNTILQRAMMDCVAAREGKENYTSARDVVFALKDIAQGAWVDADSSQEMYSILMEQTDRSGIAAVLDASAVFAGKSGELDNYNSDSGIVSSACANAALCIICDGVVDNEYGLQCIQSVARVLLRT